MFNLHAEPLITLGPRNAHRFRCNQPRSNCRFNATRPIRAPFCPEAPRFMQPPNAFPNFDSFDMFNNFNTSNRRGSNRTNNNSTSPKPKPKFRINTANKNGKTVSNADYLSTCLKSKIISNPKNLKIKIDQNSNTISIKYVTDDFENHFSSQDRRGISEDKSFSMTLPLPDYVKTRNLYGKIRCFVNEDQRLTVILPEKKSNNDVTYSKLPSQSKSPLKTKVVHSNQLYEETPHKIFKTVQKDTNASKTTVPEMSRQISERETNLLSIESIVEDLENISSDCSSISEEEQIPIVGVQDE